MNLKENIAYLKYFGLKLSFWKIVNKLFVGDIDNAKNKLSWWVHDKNNEVIEQYIAKACPNTYRKLISGKYDSVDSAAALFESDIIRDQALYDNVIWTMWWQGEENAPILVKKCIESMRKHSNGHKVIVLDQDNYESYVKLPEIVRTRFNEYLNDKSELSKITLDRTKLSDIIRAYLLYYYGGLWVDSTVFFSGDIHENLFTDVFSTLGQDNKWYIGKGKWSTFFMASVRGNGLVKYNYDMHIEYWSNIKYFVNYLMTDHMYDIAYKKRRVLAEMVDNVRCGNKKCMTIGRNYNLACDDELFQLLIKEQNYHKLSWKWWTSESDSMLVTRTTDKELNWLGKLLMLGEKDASL